jgi:hypothetical protein
MAFDSDAIRRIVALISDSPNSRMGLLRACGAADDRVEAGDHCTPVSEIAVAQRSGCKWLSFRVVNVIIELYRYSSDTCAL